MPRLMKPWRWKDSIRPLALTHRDLLKHSSKYSDDFKWKSHCPTRQFTPCLTASSVRKLATDSKIVQLAISPFRTTQYFYTREQSLSSYAVPDPRRRASCNGLPSHNSQGKGSSMILALKRVWLRQVDHPTGPVSSAMGRTPPA